MSIVVTAATGQLGRHVVEQLLARGVGPAQVVATGRSLDRLTDLAERGVRTRLLDFDDPATIEAALNPGDTLLLVSGPDVGRRVAQHRAVLDAAREVGVARLAYTSALAADRSALPVAPDHVATENDIRASGIPFTFFRNGWYTENYAPAAQQAAATGTVVSSAGDGRVASATRQDYAAAIAAALATDGHEGKIYELSGDEAWTFDDLADALSTLLGREVHYQRVSPEEHLSILREVGLDEQTAQFLVAIDRNIRDGALAIQTGDLSRLAGRPSTPLVEGLRPLVGS